MLYIQLVYWRSGSLAAQWPTAGQDPSLATYLLSFSVEYTIHVSCIGYLCMSVQCLFALVSAIWNHVIQLALLLSLAWSITTASQDTGSFQGERTRSWFSSFECVEPSSNPADPQAPALPQALAKPASSLFTGHFAF